MSDVKARYRPRKGEKIVALVIYDRDGWPLYSPETFRKAIAETREYIDYLLEELPDDHELRIHGLLDALYPLKWLAEESVIKETRIDRKSK